MHYVKKVQLFLIGSFIFFFCAQAETFNLSCTEYKTDKQIIATLPSIVAGLGVGCGAYCFANIPTERIVVNGKVITIGLSEKIRRTVRMSVGHFLAKKILSYKDEELSKMWKRSSLCQATDMTLSLSMKLATWFVGFKIASSASRTAHTFVHRGKWAMHLAHTLKEQVKLLAVLNTITNELNTIVTSFEDHNIATLVMASDIEHTYKGLIEDHTSVLASLLEDISRITQRYHGLSGCRLFDSDIQAVIHFADQDIYELVQGNSLERTNVIACVNDKDDLLNAVTKFYEASDLMKHGEYTLLWKGARKVNESARTILKYTKRLLKRNSIQLNDAIKSCERVLWWKSKLSLLPAFDLLFTR